MVQNAGQWAMCFDFFIAIPLSDFRKEDVEGVCNEKDKPRCPSFSYSRVTTGYSDLELHNTSICGSKRPPDHYC